VTYLRAQLLLLRQLTAHRGYVLRRASAEASARLLLRLVGGLPGVARFASWLHPASPAPHLILARRLDRRGNEAGAARHRSEAARLSRNTLETSILTTLRNTLAARKTQLGRTSDYELERLLRNGELDQAVRQVELSEGRLGQRIDRLLAVARAFLQDARPQRTASLCAQAVGLDEGRPDAWSLLGQARLELGEADLAIQCLDKARALDPANTTTIGLLAEALSSRDLEAARQQWWELLSRAPCNDSAVLALEETYDTSDLRSANGRLLLDSNNPKLDIGGQATLDLEVADLDGQASLFVLEPCGSGLLCSPRGRIPVSTQHRRMPLTLEAKRSNDVNGGTPWRLRLALIGKSLLDSIDLHVDVKDDRPGSVFYIITEDHELYDERELTSASDARTTLVDKSRLAEEICNEQGGVWTHMIDVSSLALVEWAKRQSLSSAWREVDEEARRHLIESVERGNDLGLHMHAFHAPDSGCFAHGFDEKCDVVTTDADFLATPLPERGFWSRAFPALGDVDKPGTRAWATWRAVGFLESLARLGDPRYRVSLFRAGSFDFGEDPAEKARALTLLSRLGILADSDVPKPRLYHRPLNRAAYPVSDDPTRAESDPGCFRSLEIRSEFNIEADFLSDTGVLNGYVDQRMARICSTGGRPKAGIHIICAMTHDKFINWRMGKVWNSLDPEYGDWATIRDHLAHVAKKHPAIGFATARDAVLAWYEYYSPIPVAWREEEIIVLSDIGCDTDVFRYTIRLLGRDIEISGDRRHHVRVQIPAWLEGKALSARVERSGRDWPARHLPMTPCTLEFEVDDRDVEWELVVTAVGGNGIVGEPAREGELRLSSALPYRRATVEVPEALSPTRQRERVRNVYLAPSETGSYEAIWSSTDASGAGGIRAGSGRGGNLQT